MRILLIEDDQLIGDGIKAGLSRHGFSVDWFTEGATGLAAPEAADYDAAVLDLSLPGLDGMDILGRWRKIGHDLPVLILTARGTLDDRIEGLTLGADDYMVKPFALQELSLRLRALIRRSHGLSSATLAHGDVSLDPVARSVCRAGAEVPMSPKEIQLVELLLLNRTAVLSKAAIEEKLYAWGEEVASNAVEVHVHHIRRKLGPKFVKTVHRLGYRLGEAE